MGLLSKSTALTLALVAGLCACKRDAPPSGDSEGGACDQAALARLAKQLDAAQPEARVLLVAEGLLAACPGALYPTTAYYLREVATPAARGEALLRNPSADPAFMAAKQRVCADPDALGSRLSAARATDYGRIAYEVCGYERYGLIDPSETDQIGGAGWFVWTTHDQLLADGTPPEIAKSISRAMMLFEQVTFGPTLIQTLDGQRLPKVAGGPLVDGMVISASAKQLVVFEQPLAVLDDGVLLPAAVSKHVVMPLFEVLSEEAEKSRAVAEANEREWVGRILLALDARVRFGSVVDIMYTAGRVGFSEFGFVVEATYPVKQAIYLRPPKFELGVAQQPSLKVFIDDAGYHVRRPGDEESVLLAKLEGDAEGPEAWDRAKLGELARALHERRPELTTAVVSANNEVRHEVVVATYAALLGDGCEQLTGEGCMFPDLILEAGAG